MTRPDIDLDLLRKLASGKGGPRCAGKEGA
jgi:hypothetical protein